jgi:hypothetical protein
VRARYEDRYSYSIAVECFSDGSVRLTPIGPRVQRHGDRTRLPAALRDEVGALGLAFARVYP